MTSVGVLQERPGASAEENKAQGFSVPSPSEMAEVSSLLKETEELSLQRDEQAKQHKEIVDLVWRNSLKLKVELERLKRLRDATKEEIQDAEKKHKLDCVWARKETMTLEQQVKRYQEAFASLKKRKEEQEQQQIEEAQLATDQIASLKATLQGLKKARSEIEAERQNHLASCKAARKEVLQLEGEIEDLKRDIEEKSEESSTSSEERMAGLETVQAEIEKLRAEKEELLKRKEALGTGGGDNKEQDEASKLVRNAKVQLHHDVVELKGAIAVQQDARDRENQRHLRRCKAARREVLKLQQELQELKNRKAEGQRAMQQLAKDHAATEELSKAEVAKLREEVGSFKFEEKLQAAAMVKNDSQDSLNSSSGGTFSPLLRNGAMSPYSPCNGSLFSISRQESLAVDAFDDLLAEEEFQRALALHTGSPQATARAQEMIPSKNPQQQLGNSPVRGTTQVEVGSIDGVSGTPGGVKEMTRDADEQDPLMGVAVASTSMLCSPPDSKAAQEN